MHPAIKHRRLEYFLFGYLDFKRMCIHRHIDVLKVMFWKQQGISLFKGHYYLESEKDINGDKH